MNRRGVPPLVVTGLIAVATTGLVISGVLAGIAIAQPGKTLDASTVALIGLLASPAGTATAGLCAILASTRTTTEAAPGTVTVTPPSTPTDDDPPTPSDTTTAVTVGGVTVAPTPSPPAPRRPRKRTAKKASPRRPK